MTIIMVKSGARQRVPIQGWAKHRCARAVASSCGEQDPELLQQCRLADRTRAHEDQCLLYRSNGNTASTASLDEPNGHHSWHTGAEDPEYPALTDYKTKYRRF
jgi:hypothetical protein